MSWFDTAPISKAMPTPITIKRQKSITTCQREKERISLKMPKAQEKVEYVDFTFMKMLNGCEEYRERQGQRN